jgi:hypothetical protein
LSRRNKWIEEFEKEQKKLLKDSEIAAAWLSYHSLFPHLSAFFRSAAQFSNQIAVVNGKKAGSDINLYKLFLEQSFNLLREDGHCGIIIPGGIYTDLGAKQLREMLFSKTRLDSLFGLSNERYLFEGVHHAQKFCLLTFHKGGKTQTFTASFRINPREAIGAADLEGFLHGIDQHVSFSANLVKRLSPDSLSIMEFRNATDLAIAQKLMQFPMLRSSQNDVSEFVLTNEFHMTGDSHLFKSQAGEDRLTLFEGKMIHQFDHLFGKPRYWIEEKSGRKAILGSDGEIGEELDYQGYRFAHRSVASSTNEKDNDRHDFAAECVLWTFYQRHPC